MTIERIDPLSETTQFFMKKIRNRWIDSGASEAECDRFIDKKIQAIRDGKLSGVTVSEQGVPLGIIWRHCMSIHYGSMYVEYEMEDALHPLIEGFLQSGDGKGTMMELDTPHTKEWVGEQLVAHGYIGLARQGMVAALSGMMGPRLEKDSYSVRPLSRNSMGIVAKISWPAHQYSNDYPNYGPLSSYENRYKMEEEFWGGEYGTIIQGASWLLLNDGVPVSICETVNSEYWGQSNFPWIFDIATDVAHMGHGYGRDLLRFCMGMLWELGHDLVGLSVTKSNGGAIGVYNTLGFGVEEYRTEYIYPLGS